jgi:hypothetical protein
MKSKLMLALSALAGVVVGGFLMLSLPTSGKLPSPAGSEPPAGGSGIAASGAAPVETLLAWTPGGLPAGLAAEARAIPGVQAVAEVGSGVLWLTGWGPAEKPEVSAPAGLSIPVEVAAVDPDQYSSFVPPAERDRFLELKNGGALLGDTGSQLRGIESEGRLRFGEVTLEVGGVVEDGLIGAHEVVVSTETAAVFQVLTPKYLLIELGPDGTRKVVEDGLTAALPEGTRIRVRGPGETPVFRHGDAVLAMSQVKNLFGEFAAGAAADGTIEIDPAWLEENVVTGEVPLLGTIRCHRAVMPQVNAALEEVFRRGLGHLVRRDDFGGCFSPRFLNRDTRAGLSHHAWGVALDVNASENPFGAEPDLDPRLVEILERWGLAWGGEWLVPDGMHFEFVRWPLSPKG